MLHQLLSKRGAKWSNSGHREQDHIVTDFGDTERETDAIINSVAILPCSHWGRLSITGRDHLNFLQRMTTNDFETLKSGMGIESIFTEAKGRIIDLGVFYHYEGTTLCILSPNSTQNMCDWLDKYTFSEEMTLNNIEAQSEMIEVLGPEAEKVISSVFQIDIEKFMPHQLLESSQTPPDSWLCVRPFGRHNGVRIIVNSEDASHLWRQLETTGAIPVGETSWNSARIELGIPANPNELNKNHNPWEAGLGSAISLEKGCYVGQEIIARLEAYKKIKKNLWGILFDGGVTPKPGTKIKVNGKFAGTITSSSSSSRTGVIAIAYISKEYWHMETTVVTEPGNLNGKIIPLPFKPEKILINGRNFSKENQ
jgi:folate-binding protein YgfZ